MTHCPPLALLEEIASAAVVAEASDRHSIEVLLSLFEKLHANLEAQREGPLRESAARGVSLLQSILAGQSKDPSGDLDRVGAIVSDLQQALERGGEPGAKALPTGPSDATPFTLPEEVDEALFREFLSLLEIAVEEMEGEILALESGQAKAKAALKQRIHGLKGEAGMVGLEDVGEVCHAIEDCLEAPLGRREKIDRLLEARDWISRALASYERRQRPSQPAAEITAVLRRAPEKPAAGEKPPAAPPASAAAPPASAAAPPASVGAPPPASAPAAAGSAGGASGSAPWDEETIAILGDFLQEGEDNLSKADQTLTSVERNGPDPEAVNLLFRIFHSIKGVAASLDLQEITALSHTTETMMNLVRQGSLALKGGVLDLLFDVTRLLGVMLGRVRQAIDRGAPLAPSPEMPALRRRIEAVIRGEPPEEPDLPDVPPGVPLGKILSETLKVVSPEVVDQALAAQRETGRKLGEELVARGAVEPKQVAQALRLQEAAAEGAAVTRLRETIKVDLARVDHLVEMIGELVIVEAMVINDPDILALSSPRVRNYLGQLAKITRDLQDVGLRMRMVPVRSVFQKMARVVRDLSRQSGKQVQLVISGEGAEMDRSMVEQISDPLVHMIRNAVDHGLEPATERLQAGKPPMGTIRLSAYHEGGSIVIEVADDGRGLDREAILRKALSLGLVREGEPLSDGEVYNLIFTPGFSTANKVTEISGRGVGMDVLRRNVEQMRGRVLISTERGVHTTFKIVLPLTLAIIDGMLVACGPERYILPTLSIVESIQPDETTLVTFAGKGELVNVRGEILPLLRLGRLFGVPGAVEDPTQGLVVVVESLGRKVGLLVDEVVTQQQVVIKSLGAGLQNVPFVAGAAILSDGRVGLILNTDELASYLRRGSAGPGELATETGAAAA
jgi:two-component system chemotaxis sensor kinase CheA